MKKTIRLGVLVGVFLGISSCIDELNLALEESNQALVIDAWLGNVPADTYVKVYQTAPYVSGALNPSYTPVPVDRVAIEDREGQRMVLNRIGGIFRAPADFYPEAGKDYRLVIELSEGAVFESSWETMPPPVVIEDIVAVASERQVMITSGESQFFQTRTFADVQARVTDPGVGELGYLIETSGIEELYTNSNSDNCSCICYEYRPNIFAGMNLTSNSFFQGRDFGISLGEIPLSHLGKYYVSAKVKAVTQSNYDYLSRVDEQQRNSGSIFDPAPFRIRGNIKKRGEGNQLVLGGFFLFQQSTFEKMLFRAQIRSESLELNHRPEPLPMVGGSCTEFYRNATSIPPAPFRP